MKYVRAILRFLREANVIKTIIFNYRHLPFKIALRLPIHLFGRVDLYESTKGRISFSSSTRPHFGAWKIGYETGLPYGSRNALKEVMCLCIEGELTLGERGRISQGSSICIRKNGKLSLGNDVYIGYAARIICKQRIVIGEGTHFAWECQVYDTDFHYIYDEESIVKRNIAPIYIGQYSWIGNRVTISKGTHLGNFSIVAANSIVNKNYGSEEHCIYGGVPARKIKVGYSRVFDYSKQYQIDEWFVTNPDKETCNLKEQNILV